MADKEGGLMLKIAICDDEQIVCADIEKIILDFQKESGIHLEVEVFYSGIDLYKFIVNDYAFDLIFLDIEMQDLNGIQLGNKIRNELENYITKIVYISSKDSYDRQLFEVQPMHFLPKPVDKEKIIADVKLALKILGKRSDVFSYKIGHSVYKVSIKDILYFESLDREIKLVSTKGTVCFYSTIEAVLSQVSSYQFIQIHRSYIINYAYVSKFRYEEVIMMNGEHLLISQRRRKDVRDLLISYEKEED
ncbi:LytR/AlgR family response regulator transcription factor [Lacrimispora brassicae]